MKASMKYFNTVYKKFAALVQIKLSDWLGNKTKINWLKIKSKFIKIENPYLTKDDKELLLKNYKSKSTTDEISS